MAKGGRDRTLLITPVQYAKAKGIRPQMVYNWIRRQGGPCTVRGGKYFVNSATLDEWLDDRKVARVERQKHAAERRERGGSNLPPEVTEALIKFSSQRVPHYCSNCGRETDFLCDLCYLGDPSENYRSGNCSECNLNYRMGPLSNEDALQVLLHGATLTVPEPEKEQLAPLKDPDEEEPVAEEAEV